MKKIAPVLALVLLVFTFCTKDKKETAPINKTQTGNESVISWQQCVDFTDHELTVCFINANEYRCPCNVDCVWEGAVDITLQLIGPGLDTTVVLTTNSSTEGLKDTVEIGDTNLKISSVTPIDCNQYQQYQLYTVKVTLTQ
jgi:hypothetical protein